MLKTILKTPNLNEVQRKCFDEGQSIVVEETVTFLCILSVFC